MPKSATSKESMLPNPPPDDPKNEPPRIAETAGTLARQYAQAQRRFDQGLQEAQLLVHKILLEAYRDYVAQVEEAQRDLGGYVADAYQSYLSALVGTSSSASGALADRGTDAYLELVRVGSDLASQHGFRDSVESAYQELTVALTSREADATQAYRQYMDRLNEAWRAAVQTQSQAEQELSRLLAAWQEELARRQQELDAAYQSYVGNLTEAYARSDIERRMSSAAQGYAAAAQDAWKQAQNIYADAAANLIEAQKTALASLRSETATAGS